MHDIQYRKAIESDIPELAGIRSKSWGTEEYWTTCITEYMNGRHHPQHALMPRILYVASKEETAIGLIAGHLTKRFDCDGELQWIDVLPEFRSRGLASNLLRKLTVWFKERNALQICVDCDPANLIARKFYKKYGAEDLNKHWLVWKNISSILRE